MVVYVQNLTTLNWSESQTSVKMKLCKISFSISFFKNAFDLRSE